MKEFKTKGYIMTSRKLIRELINKRIESLFGNIGGEKGQYYFDNYYCSIVQVTNNFRGVRKILGASSPSRLLEILDGIETYLYYQKIEKNINNELDNLTTQNY